MGTAYGRFLGTDYEPDTPLTMAAQRLLSKPATFDVIRRAGTLRITSVRHSICYNWVPGDLSWVNS